MRSRPNNQIHNQRLAALALVLVVSACTGDSTETSAPASPEETTTTAASPTTTTVELASTTSQFNTPKPTFPQSVATYNEVGLAISSLFEQLDMASGVAYTFVERQTTSGSASLQLPADWIDIDIDSPWVDDNDVVIGDSIVAGPSIARFYNGGERGIFVGLKRSEPGWDTLQDLQSGGGSDAIDQGCISGGPARLIDGDANGHFDVYYGCDFVLILVALAGDGYDMSVYARADSKSDASVVVRFLETLMVDPSRIRQPES